MFLNRDCNQKSPFVFCTLKKYYSHFIIQELGKFRFKINVIPNGLEKYMSFKINNKLAFNDSFQLLRCSLDSLIKSLGKDDFNYLSQESHSDVSDLVKQKRFYPYEYTSGFEKSKERF